MPPAPEPRALVLLANLGRPRRPSGAAVASSEPVFPNPTKASKQLAELIDHPVTAADLADLRRLHTVTVGIAEAILASKPPDYTALNALAATSTAHVELVATTRETRLIWSDPSPAAALARRLIEELTALDPTRLHHCARPECDLIFYDTTRSRTRRYHAEDPCGWRDRQRAHRTRTSRRS